MSCVKDSGLLSAGWREYDWTAQVSVLQLLMTEAKAELPPGKVLFSSVVKAVAAGEGALGQALVAMTRMPSSLSAVKECDRRERRGAASTMQLSKLAPISISSMLAEERVGENVFMGGGIGGQTARARG